MASIWNSPWDKDNQWYNSMMASGQYWNDFDLAHASQDQNFANEIFAAKNDYANATTPEARALANQRAETARSKYNYSSGTAGAEYNSVAPTTLSPATNAGYWGGEVKSGYESYKNRDPFNYDPYTPGTFSYDYKTDPLYGVYKKEYTREGQRAMQDALASAATMTGGVPSSYAQTAAQQANNYYASKIADAIPQLRQQAYSEFADAENRRRNAWLDNLGLAQYQYETGANQLQNVYQMALDNYGLDLGNAQNAAAIQAKFGDMSGYENLYGVSGLQGLYDAANAEEGNYAYAFSEDGGTPYRITNGEERFFIANSQPGESMTSSDGTILQNVDGQIVIQKDGRTYRYGEAKPTYSGYLPQPPITPVKNVYDNVYNTIMNEAVYGGDMGNVRKYADDAIAQAQADNYQSLTREQVSNILTMLGY